MFKRLLSRTKMIMAIGWVSLTFSPQAFAQKDMIQAVGGNQAAQVAGGATGAGKNKILIGSSFMFFKSGATQGEQTYPGGITSYSQSYIQYNFVEKLSAVGLIYQHDEMGSFLVNTGVGLKAELTWKGYYLESGFSFAQQKFTNRAVRSRTGTQVSYGGGIRVPFLSDFLYFDGGVKNRVTKYTKQDGVKLAVPYTEELMMPFIGIGVSF